MTEHKTCKICKWNILAIEEEQEGICGSCQKKQHAETFVERVIRLGEEGIRKDEG